MWIFEIKKEWNENENKFKKTTDIAKISLKEYSKFRNNIGQCVKKFSSSTFYKSKLEVSFVIFLTKF